MGSHYASLLARNYEFEELTEPTCISDIDETCNCYFMVYNGPYLIAEGSLIALKYKLPLMYFDMPFRSYEPNPEHPRVITIRL